MKSRVGICCLGLILVVIFAFGVLGAEFDLTISGGASVPVGDFGEASDIITPTAAGGYDASGGGAEAGLGFNVDLAYRATARICVGGRFGYSRYDADASDIMETLIEPVTDEVESIDAFWTLTSLTAFARITAVDLERFEVYGHFGLGYTKMKNSFDVTFMSQGYTAITTSDFALGNHLTFTAGMGIEYRLRERLWLLAELRLNQVFSDGAEATASIGGTGLAGTQRFDTQCLEIVAGVRIPLSGI